MRSPDLRSSTISKGKRYLILVFKNYCKMGFISAGYLFFWLFSSAKSFPETCRDNIERGGTQALHEIIICDYLNEIIDNQGKRRFYKRFRTKGQTQSYGISNIFYKRQFACDLTTLKPSVHLKAVFAQYGSPCSFPRYFFFRFHRRRGMVELWNGSEVLFKVLFIGAEP